MRSIILISAAISVMMIQGICSADIDKNEGDLKRVRFYTGNLSVGYFMQYWGTGGILESDIPTDAWCKDMKSAGVSSACDYIGWCKVESEQGKFDWSLYNNNYEILKRNGLGYNVFCWLHFPPKWFMETPDYVPYRCVEHDRPIQMTSLWAPGTLKIYDRFYKALAERFGDKIEFIRLATPCEYGEIGYPNGMTRWLVPQIHAHDGYWCNDRFARADFADKMEYKYTDIGSLNKKWGTDFQSFSKIEYPEIAYDKTKYIAPLDMTPQNRRWILDFIGWYYDSQGEFVKKAVGIVRKYFPKKEIIVSLGYGSQLTMYGNDDVGIAKICKELEISSQTPGNVGYICQKNISTPAHFYKIPYITEPPGDMNRNEEINRIWSDASNGIDTYFDYPQNLLGAKDVFHKYGDYLDGSKPVCDSAVFFPTSDHRLRTEHWPARTIHGVNVLREFIDYDLVDERLIREKALRKYKILIAYDGNIMEKSTIKALTEWIKSGGVMFIRDFGNIETVEGDKEIYKSFYPSLELSERNMPHLTRRIGKGYVTLIPSKPDDWRDFAAEVSGLAHNLSRNYPGTTDTILIDGKYDGVLTTLFKNRILLINQGDEPIQKTVVLRESDFKDSALGKPDSYTAKLSIQPHTIAAIELK